MSKNLPKKYKAELAKHEIDIRIGDMVLDCGDGQGPYRVEKITSEGIWLEHQWDDGSWGSYGTIEFERFRNRFIKIDKPIEELEVEVLEKVKHLDELKDEQSSEISEETALTVAGGKETLQSTKKAIEKRRDEFATMYAILRRKTDEINNIVQGFRETIERVQKVIDIVELYLGIKEEITQIQQGAPCLATEPICIRQQLLYMDEEFGDPTNGGLDFQKLEDFDSWLLKPENMTKILPEKKGVIALRVRREDKTYSHGSTIADAFMNATMNENNHRTYFLIRNGDNIYRIWSNVTVHPRLFPTRDEFEKVKIRSHRIDGTEYEYESPFEDRRIEEAEFEYKKYGLMLQGLLHRTFVFQPMTHVVDIFKPETWQGLLRFIRDDEALLPSGRLSWREWQKTINSKIEVGSRIVFCPPSYSWEKDFMSDRVAYQLRHVPHPSKGVYTVVPGTYREPNKLRFMYNPEDIVYREYNYWDGDKSGPRKNSIGFSFDSREVLNYDQIDLDDIDFYLNCRTDRHNYLDMIPLLRAIKKWRLAELEREKLFVQLVVQRNNVEETVVWKVIEWWKFKNKWKRPIEEDDAKALRMIERKIKHG